MATPLSMADLNVTGATDLAILDGDTPPPMEHCADATKVARMETDINQGFNADFVRRMGMPSP
ncbi:MAG: hypothetical protein HRT94_07300 [Alphaproteobacteria bacterium]|nr:hypothetical protein [Alphaproteobacteria bacterium]